MDGGDVKCECAGIKYLRGQRDRVQQNLGTFAAIDGRAPLFTLVLRIEKVFL